ncbi:MAG: hypothetical protein NDJ92_05245 [Thermoanaerobaculia bacterium]|nr:hypothetical protein [Thermoanaerobaculia bacterium]
MTETPPDSQRSPFRLVAVLVPVALIAASLLLYRAELRARLPVEAAVRTYGIDIRRPLEAEMIGYSPAADIGSQVFAMAAVSDALGRVRLKGLDQIERDAWLDVPTKLEAELAVARNLSLDAAAARPGWPMHRYLLGKVAYTADRRTIEREIVPSRWLIPLRSAARSAPGADSAAETLAAVTLEAWETIPESDRRDAQELFRRAFLDPSFVRKAWGVSANAIGAELASGAVPESAPSLMAAARSAAAMGEGRVAESLYRRWESAEWKEREADLTEMRTRSERGDWTGLVGASRGWASKHSPRDFDTPAAREQLEEILRLWPRDQVSAWAGSRQAEILRYFLAGRMDGIDGEVLAGAASSLSGVPFPTQARLFLAAGLVRSAEELASGSVTKGTFEWTDYYVDLARYHLARNARESAVEALDRIAATARGECDAALLRASLAAAPPPPEPIAMTAPDGSILPEAWATNGMLSLCVDPRATAGRTLVVELVTEGDGLVEWGWNDARSATVSAAGGASTIRVPLSGLDGRNVFFARPALGGKIVSRAARVE